MSLCLCVRCTALFDAPESFIAHRPHCKPSTDVGWPPFSASVDFAASAAANGRAGLRPGPPTFEPT